MLTSLAIICPVFAIIIAGYVCGQRGWLGPSASTELNRFVVYLALPALLFLVMAEAKWSELWQPGFVGSFAIGSFVVFGGTLGYRLLRGQHLTDAAIDGLNAGYANVGYIGFPLCEVVFGRSSLALVTIAAIMTVSVLFAVAIILVEIGPPNRASLPSSGWESRLGFGAQSALDRPPVGSSVVNARCPVAVAGDNLSPFDRSGCEPVRAGLAWTFPRRKTSWQSCTKAGRDRVICREADRPAGDHRALRLWPVSSSRCSGRNGSASGRASDRHWPVHDRGVLQARSRGDFSNDPHHYGRLRALGDRLPGFARTLHELREGPDSRQADALAAAR